MLRRYSRGIATELAAHKVLVAKWSSCVASPAAYIPASTPAARQASALGPSAAESAHLRADRRVEGPPRVEHGVLGARGRAEDKYDVARRGGDACCYGSLPHIPAHLRHL